MAIATLIAVENDLFWPAAQMCREKSKIIGRCNHLDMEFRIENVMARFRNESAL